MAAHTELAPLSTTGGLPSGDPLEPFALRAAPLGTSPALPPHAEATIEETRATTNEASRKLIVFSLPVPTDTVYAGPSLSVSWGSVRRRQ